MNPKNVPLGEIFQRLRERYLVTYRVVEGQSESVHRIAVGLAAAATARLQDFKIAGPGYFAVEPR